MKQPIAWMTKESEKRLLAGGNDSRNTVPVHAHRSNVATIPVFIDPQIPVPLASEPEAQPVAGSLTDELMNCVDRLGHEADAVDSRVWDHLLVYAPKPVREPVAWMLKSGHGTQFRECSDNPMPDLMWNGKPAWVPLYTHPSPRYEPITEETLKDTWLSFRAPVPFARVIEAEVLKRLGVTK